jgi:hypothetical protein
MWMRATRMGQQVAQLHGSCTMMMVMMKIRYFLENKFEVAVWNSQE